MAHHHLVTDRGDDSSSFLDTNARIWSGEITNSRPSFQSSSSAERRTQVVDLSQSAFPTEQPLFAASAEAQIALPRGLEQGKERYASGQQHLDQTVTDLQQALQTIKIGGQGADGRGRTELREALHEFRQGFKDFAALQRRVHDPVASAELREGRIELQEAYRDARRAVRQDKRTNQETSIAFIREALKGISGARTHLQSGYDIALAPYA